MIIVDSREQKPIWEVKEGQVEIQKLDEGDYTTDLLLNKAHIERKSGIDLYGSLVQGHKRFIAELERANEKGLNLSVFVECPKRTFISKRFKGGWRLKLSPKILAKIVSTVEEKYEIDFVWLDDRSEFKQKAEEWFKNQEERINNVREIEENI